MCHPRASQKKYYEKLLSQFEGATIEKILFDSEDGELFIGLSVKTKDGASKSIWFYSDEEGNGPGVPAIN